MINVNIEGIKENIGWIYITEACLVISITLIAVIIETFKAIKAKFNIWQKSRENQVENIIKIKERQKIHLKTKKKSKRNFEERGT